MIGRQARIEAGHEMMSDHARLALRHPRIVEFHKFYSEYHIFFETGTERFKVRFRVFETGDQRFFFEQSHFISTPLQEQSHTPSATTDDQPHAALQRGVQSITTFYDDAVSQGHKPAADWFVLNDLY